MKSQNQEEKLIIETPRVEQIKSSGEKPAAVKLVAVPATQPNNQPKGSRLSALDKIRKQYQGNGANTETISNQPLQQETLQHAWAAYIHKLKDAKNPAAQPFALAELKIIDENSFEVVTSNNIEQKFIEQERNELFAFLQQDLKNRLLQFTVLVNENPVEKPITDAPLSSREQFLKMAEQYPLLIELKDRLRLDLDY